MAMDRSDESATSLYQRLNSPHDRNDTLAFISNYRKDCQLMLHVLQALLHQNDPETRFDRLSIALATAGSEALPVLISSLGSNNSRIRSCALESLSILGPSAHRELSSNASVLIDLLSDPEEDTRELVFQVVGKAGVTSAVPAIIRFLEEDGCSPRMVFAASSALGRFGSNAREATTCLLGLLKRLDLRQAGARGAIIRALGCIGHEASAAIPSLIAILSEPRDSGEAGTQIADWIDAIRSITSIQPQSSVVRRLLANLLTDCEWQVRLAAAESLWRADSGSRVAIQAVIQELNHNDPTVRGEAITALFGFGSAASVAAHDIEKVLADPERNNRQLATELLNRLKRHS